MRADLLGTYDGRLRAALAAVQETGTSGFGVRRAEEAAAARGYWRILRGSYAAQRDAGAARRLDAAFGSLVAAASAGRGAPVALRRIDNALEGFRAVPLGPEEQIRRAGQLQRFLELVPIEYDRGVEDGRVTLDFEIQEAITFRDAASSALGDLAPFLLRRDPAATRAAIRLVAGLGVSSRTPPVAGRSPTPRPCGRPRRRRSIAPPRRSPRAGATRGRPPTST